MMSPVTTPYTSPFVLSLLLLISIPVVFLLAPRLLPPKILPAISDADESDDLALFCRAILSSSSATPAPPASAASYFFRRRPSPKIAFLFLTNSDLVFSPLWEKFLRHSRFRGRVFLPPRRPSSAGRTTTTAVPSRRVLPHATATSSATAAPGASEPEAEDVWRGAQWEAAWPGWRDARPVLLASDGGCMGQDDGVGHSRSLTDDDLEELKGCTDLGLGFSYDEIPKLRGTLPALEFCYSMSQRLLDDKHDHQAAAVAGAARLREGEAGE